MSIEQIRRQYGVPAKIGARVRYTGRPGQEYNGVIVGSRGPYLRIRFSALHNGRILDYHPTWELKYLSALGEE